MGLDAVLLPTGLRGLRLGDIDLGLMSIVALNDMPLTMSRVLWETLLLLAAAVVVVLEGATQCSSSMLPTPNLAAIMLQPVAHTYVT